MLACVRTCACSFYHKQPKTLEVNPRHPLIRELLRKVEAEETDKTTVDLAEVLFETALLRSGYSLPDSPGFAGRIERMLRLSMGVDLDAEVCVQYIQYVRSRSSLSFFVLVSVYVCV